MYRYLDKMNFALKAHYSCHITYYETEMIKVMHKITSILIIEGDCVCVLDRGVARDLRPPEII